MSETAEVSGSGSGSCSHLGAESRAILARLAELRAADAPTHGGRVLSYVYDAGEPELDELADLAASAARPLNGLDPTTFTSIAAMERDLIAFMRAALGGDRRSRARGPRVVGSVTSGGTESCLLAVKTARDLWRAANPSARNPNARNPQGMDGRPAPRPRLVTATTAHAAFQKAARLFDLDWDPAPCEADGSVRASELIERLGDDVALVVVSAPAYPTGAIDPIAEVAAAAAARGIPCHVDACFGGLALPWWPGVPAWDFRVPGVTSISADLHKFGYAPKGVSVLLHRGRSRHRAQFFATTGWPGYPVVNPTLLGSRSASPTAAAWAITQRLGLAGYAGLTAACVRASEALQHAARGIRGLAVLGSPVGPAFAVVADDSVPAAERVDPHHLADEVARLGFRIQHQPGLTQANGIRIPHSAHLTVTPVTERSVPELSAALDRAADAVRGRPRASARIELAALSALGYGPGGRIPSPEAAWRILRLAGAGKVASGGLPPRLATLMSLAESLPPRVAEALLTELLARASEPAS